ncbi:MAG: ferredoxin reductase [Baekduia sp.]
MSTTALAEPPVRRRLIDAAGALSTPLLPDDYLTVFNELWSLHDLRGRIEQLIPRGRKAMTVVIRPGRRWPGHEAGQHLAVGVDTGGVRHWRSYSLTSDPDRPDGCISITVKRVDDGRVSTQLTTRAKVGDIVRLGPPDGEFVLGAAAGRPLLFITAGSGITPVMAMLRSLERSGGLGDVVCIHSDRTAGDVIFGDELRALPKAHAGVRVIEHRTAKKPRLTGDDLDALCPDWRERTAFACGPAGLLDAIEQRYELEPEPPALNVERFEIATLLADPGDGGTVTIEETEVDVAAGEPILVAGEEAGLALESGCRMGICHRCIHSLASGQVRDLRTGELITEPGDDVQLCVTGAAGDAALLPKTDHR